jgi:hypothetical protein
MSRYEPGRVLWVLLVTLSVRECGFEVGQDSELSEDD